jgi:hypothetical protein
LAVHHSILARGDEDHRSSAREPDSAITDSLGVEPRTRTWRGRSCWSSSKAVEDYFCPDLIRCASLRAAWRRA